MHYLLLALCVAVCSTCFAADSLDSAKAVEVQKLLKNLGYDDSLERMNASVIRTLKKTYQSANLPEEIWAEYEKELNSPEYKAISVHIYLEELTLEEMKAANSFFDSPLGKSYSAKLGKIGERELIESRDWSQKVFTSIVRRYLSSRETKEKPSQAPLPTPVSTTPPAMQKAAETETWTDESKTRIVIRMRLSPAAQEENVRAQIAGVCDTFCSDSLLLRLDRIDFGRFEGLPTCTFEGISYANRGKRQCRILMSFSKTDTYVIHSFSPFGDALPKIEDVVKLGGEANEATKEAFKYLEPRLGTAIPEFQKPIDKLLEIQKKAEPTATAQRL